MSRRGFAGRGVSAYTPLQDLKGIITPNEVHFEVNHENGVTPNIDPSQHKLVIQGMVDRPLVLTMDEIKRLPSVSRICFLECNGNGGTIFQDDAKTAQDTHGRTSTTEWTGVPLSLVLREAGIQSGAKWLITQAADPSRHAHDVPVFKAMDDAMLAYAQNGAPLRIEQGFPLRLVLPGWGGRINVKWINRIRVMDHPYLPRQEIFAHMDHSPAGPLTWWIAGEKAFSYQFMMYPKSIITFPSGGQKLPGPGNYEIEGIAWSGGGAVKRVEVSTDGGRTYQDAKLQDPVIPLAHTRFRFPWRWNGQEALLQSRCTDDQGDVQPTPGQVKEIWGTDNSAECKSVMGDLCNRIPRRTVNAVITTWKLNRDGTVVNHMPSVPRSPEVAAMFDELFKEHNH
jgi:sulfane dehydrogenase subunit SoxC